MLFTKLIYREEYGANLILADWNEPQLRGKFISKRVRPSQSMYLVDPDAKSSLASVSNVAFRKTNVARWDDLIKIYDLGWDKFGGIDAVISNAGVNWGEVLPKHETDPDTGLLKASLLDTLEINLISHIYMSKCAAYYFAKHPERKCQVILTSSAAAFLDTPPLYLYSTAKAGVVGLMRSLRNDFVKANVTINTAAPWFTGMSPSQISLY